MPPALGAVNSSSKYKSIIAYECLVVKLSIGNRN
jgi:hypothetical protein